MESLNAFLKKPDAVTLEKSLGLIMRRDEKELVNQNFNNHLINTDSDTKVVYNKETGK